MKIEPDPSADALPTVMPGCKLCGFAERRASIQVDLRERNPILDGLGPVPFIHVLSVELVSGTAFNGTLGTFGLN